MLTSVKSDKPLRHYLARDLRLVLSLAVGVLMFVATAMSMLLMAQHSEWIGTSMIVWLILLAASMSAAACGRGVGRGVAMGAATFHLLLLSAVLFAALFVNTDNPT